MYFYRMISRDEESSSERRLAELATETVGIKLQIDDVPEVHFIAETPSGYIRFDRSINGYCAVNGDYICVRAGMTPQMVVQTTVHELRHAHQYHDGTRHKLSAQMLERDADLFVYEFFGSHSSSGDAVKLERVLHRILLSSDFRLKPKASARARLSNPTGTESSDDLRRQFAPVLRARSVAVQQFVDPDKKRQSFPPGIEFSAPYAAGLKLS
jgi:hypothetical protein